MREGVLTGSPEISESAKASGLHLVAFLDILGTTELTRSGHFASIPFDFVNAAGLACKFLPRIRGAAFSDCVVLSCHSSTPLDFISALAFVHRQWFSDAILVRGGVVLGEINWLDQEAGDDFFDNIKNFLYARVYGKGLIEASLLERKSGPGALCHVSDAAASVLEASVPACIFRGPSNLFVWPGSRGVEWNHHFFTNLVNTRNHDSPEGRHLRATLWFFDQLKRNSLSLPPSACPFAPEINKDGTLCV